MTSIRRAIVEALGDKLDHYLGHPDQIKTVEFLKGCDEIRVTYELPEEHRWSDIAIGDDVIDAEPVLSAMLQKMIEQEV